MNVKLDSKVMITSCCHLMKQQPDVLTSTSLMSHHAMPMHNAQIMFVHILVRVATDITVIVMLVKTSMNEMQPYLLETS